MKLNVFTSACISVTCSNSWRMIIIYHVEKSKISCFHRTTTGKRTLFAPFLTLIGVKPCFHLSHILLPPVHLPLQKVFATQDVREPQGISTLLDELIILMTNMSEEKDKK